jgi:hypothetical protein
MGSFGTFLLSVSSFFVPICTKISTSRKRKDMPLSKTRFILSTITCLCAVLATAGGAGAADDLRLKKGISFVSDTDSGFPIEGSNLDDVSLESGKASLLFFGASGDLNTNRQAKRVVDLYKQNSDKPIKFILIDVDHPANEQARALMKNHYKGYIPFEVVLDKQGKVSYSSIGEVETGTLAKELDKVLK